MTVTELARIAITGDHHGTALAGAITERMAARGHRVTNLAPQGGEIVDYPPLCAAVGELVASGDADLGIIVGGSGQGEVVACNKVRGIRAGLAYSEFAVDISRGNNNANVMVIGTKVIDDDTAMAYLDRWLATPFKGAEHARRIKQIADIEARFGAE